MGRPKGSKNKKRIEDEGEESGKASSRLEFDIAGDAKRSVVAVFLFALSVVILLGFFGQGGIVGESLGNATAVSIGWAKWVFPFFLIVASVILLLRKETSFYITKLIGLVLTFVSLTGFFHWFTDADKMEKAADAGSGGGYLGYAVAYAAVKFMGVAGGLVAIISLLLIGIIVAFNFSIVHFIDRMLRRSKSREAEDMENIPIEESVDVENEGIDGSDGKWGDDEVETISEKRSKEDENIGRIEFVEGPDRYVDEKLFTDLAGNVSSAEKIPVKNNKSKSKKNDWKLPPADLLEKNLGGMESGDTEKNAEIIEKTFKSFGIDVERGDIQIGPAVTQYSFKPAVGIKISKILELNNNLAMALAKHPIRIEAPIPGKSLVGIEVPNDVPAKVRLRNLIESPYFKMKSKESKLTLALGEDVSGEYILSDLGKMPHLLIAGSTGTGKSVCVNSIVTTLLYQNSPEDLKFIMVDPKRVELSMYSGIPHLLSPVITENSKVVNALKWVVSEMERRYRLLQDMKSQNIDSYHDKLAKGEKRKYTDPDSKNVIEEPMEKLPYIVVVIDELAELMMSHGKEVEGAIVRVAQLARAVGIHLIVSTQRPEVKIITGLIKANINARIALKVNTQVDSRTILDMAGAEKLLGRGDMLFLSADSPKTKRIQGIFLSEAEVKKVVKFIKDQYEAGKEKHGEKIDEGNEIGIAESPDSLSFGNAAPLNLDVATGGDSEDDLYEAAKAEVERAGKASASLLQRRLRVGYARAARLLDILEDKGIVGPADGAKPREVYTAENKPHFEDADIDQSERDKWQL
ncbi:MAG: DNA translocase FtsK 4TM domain-containing protein [Candidatus Moranbacteria bacterium]|nr:DNA translocase FtsK 4TM domain-containing protein [Candidatus Moranbacteria bacterium]